MKWSFKPFLATSAIILLLLFTVSISRGQTTPKETRNRFPRGIISKLFFKGRPTTIRGGLTFALTGNAKYPHQSQGHDHDNDPEGSISEPNYVPRTPQELTNSKQQQLNRPHSFTKGKDLDSSSSTNLESNYKNKIPKGDPPLISFSFGKQNSKPNKAVDGSSHKKQVGNLNLNNRTMTFPIPFLTFSLEPFQIESSTVNPNSNQVEINLINKVTSYLMGFIPSQQNQLQEQEQDSYMPQNRLNRPKKRQRPRPFDHLSGA